jgi:hypothetical protein
MANKKDNPRPIFKPKSAAEKMLEGSLSPVSNIETEVEPLLWSP